jgi:hypothetical protein
MAFGTRLIEGPQELRVDGFQSLFFWNGLWDTATALLAALKRVPKTALVVPSL